MPTEPEPLRAVHVLRADHASHVGGDIAELHGTVEGLRRHGVDAVAATLDDAPADVDVVHLYNLWLPVQLIRDHGRAIGRWPQARVFVTPIFGRFNLAQVARSRQPSVWAKCARRELRSLTTARAIRRILCSATLVLPNTSAEARSIERVFRTQDGMRAAVLPNGIRVRDWTVDRSALDRNAFLNARGLRHDVRTVVACVGRIEPRKNQRGLVRAMAQVPDAAVVFVGPESDARYSHRVRQDATALLRDRAAFLGPLSQPDVRDVLAHADVHALPSYLEVASTVAMEAAAAGCEVVLPRTDATHEYWGDRVQTCAPNDSDSIARAITRSISSPRQPELAHHVRAFDFYSLGRRAAELYRSSL